MGFSSGFIRVFRALLPAPFTIAIGLTAVTFWMAFFLTDPAPDSDEHYLITLMGYWEQGLWTNGLMVFALQMMLMLVLGHVLALSRPVNWLINQVAGRLRTTELAAAVVTLLTVLVALFNWGLGLVFGAILARKVGEYAATNNLKINYPLIGAAGYSGLMVWHGGISGSSLSKVAEEGHLHGMMANLMPPEQLAQLPASIDFSYTVFSFENVVISLALIAILPLAMYFAGRFTGSAPVTLRQSVLHAGETEEKPTGAERLDHSAFIAFFFGSIVLLWAFYKMFFGGGFLKFWNPNNINFLLLGLAIVFHGSFNRFLKGVDEAIGGAAGILVQFPLYFGIMGIMKSSGMVGDFSSWIVSISNETTYPLFTFLSAGIVNIFVPSGGGQWAVQGPIIVQAATDMGVGLPKSILAMAYGDQLTNMLQPFWALPLLGITGLRAKEILPFTLYLMVVGGAIFVLGLLWMT